ncbi:MAG: hypothetical protein AB7S26_33885 [Sandaracinaceae bacterium]
MLFEEDPLVRQIKQLARMLAALAGASGDMLTPSAEDELEGAYLALLGLDARFASELAVPALVRMLHDPQHRALLPELLDAHAAILERRGDALAAQRMRSRAEEASGLVGADAPDDGV